MSRLFGPLLESTPVHLEGSINNSLLLALAFLPPPPPLCFALFCFLGKPRRRSLLTRHACIPAIRPLHSARCILQRFHPLASYLSGFILGFISGFRNSFHNTSSSILQFFRFTFSRSPPEIDKGGRGGHILGILAMDEGKISFRCVSVCVNVILFLFVCVCVCARVCVSRLWFDELMNLWTSVQNQPSWEGVRHKHTHTHTHTHTYTHLHNISGHFLTFVNNLSLSLINCSLSSNFKNLHAKAKSHKLEINEISTSQVSREISKHTSGGLGLFFFLLSFND